MVVERTCYFLWDAKRAARPPSSQTILLQIQNIRTWIWMQCYNTFYGCIMFLVETPLMASRVKHGFRIENVHQCIIWNGQMLCTLILIVGVPFGRFIKATSHERQ